MHNVSRALEDVDDAILPLLAKVWRVTIEPMMNGDEIIDALSKAMLQPDRAEQVWSTLNDAERGALFLLIGSGAKMLTPRFERLFGEIRRMGAGQIERERPDLNPASTA